MPFLLFLIIVVLVSAVTVALRHIERLADCRAENGRSDHAVHWQLALGTLVVLLAVVGVLEWLLVRETISFSVPGWLYVVHVCAALAFGLTFAAKGVTAVCKMQGAHVRLSRPFWLLWWLTAATAVLIGIWNLFAA